MGTVPASFGYETWNALLAEIVTPEGRVDYARLAERRDRLARFIAQLAAAQPGERPGALPDRRGSARLLAQRVQRLHAGTRSSPSTRSRRCGRRATASSSNAAATRAGGRAVSLDDIEHEILRGEFAEPRIHFAINCGSNGCPPMRPRPIDGDGLCARRCAPPREQFLARSGTAASTMPRAASTSRASSRCMREDFAGASGSTRGLPPRRAALRRRAPGSRSRDRRLRGRLQHLRLGPERRRIAQPHLGPILFHEPVEHFNPGDTRAARAASLRRATSATAPARGARSTAHPTAGTSRTRRRCSIRRCATRRRRRQPQVLRRRADPARAARSSTRCATCARAASAACSRSSPTA